MRLAAPRDQLSQLRAARSSNYREDAPDNLGMRRSIMVIAVGVSTELRGCRLFAPSACPLDLACLFIYFLLLGEVLISPAVSRPGASM